LFRILNHGAGGEEEDELHLHVALQTVKLVVGRDGQTAHTDVELMALIQEQEVKLSRKPVGGAVRLPVLESHKAAIEMLVTMEGYLPVVDVAVKLDLLGLVVSWVSVHKINILCSHF
jgi:hypothetical protein